MRPEKHSYTVVRRMSHIGNERGFNLVEMTVVILILAVLVAIAVPIFMRDTKAGDRATAEHNLSAGERLYDYVWYDRLAMQNTPDGVNSYRDYDPPAAVKAGSFYQSHGYALVDAQYMSIASPQMQWARLTVGGGSATSGALAAADLSDLYLADAPSGYSVQSIWKGGTQVSSGGDIAQDWASSP